MESYQNSLFVFANEENALGILLKECGKHDRTKAGKIMSITGKSLTQSSHQMIRLYMPLLRLYQEMETFHSRAVNDTADTVDKLEDKRSQYRASLLWMKNISEKLDPDIYKQLDKFRRVQNQVRSDKKVFDSIQLDVVQKIDLLMASRCNLMNQILAPYQATLLETFEKNFNNFKSIEEMIKLEDIYEYEFKTLKELNPLQIKDSPQHLSGAGEKSEDLLKDESHLDGNNNESNNNGDDKSDALIDVSLDSVEEDTARPKSDSIELADNTMDMLETLFGKTVNSNEEPSSKEENKKKVEQHNREEDLNLLRSTLNANLLDTEDDEMKQIERLLGPSQSKVSGNWLEVRNNDIGGELFADWSDVLGKKSSTKPGVDSSGSEIGGKQGTASCGIDLMGGDDVAGGSGSYKKDNNSSIMDLLTNELNEIDNSSYSKSLQRFQI